MISFQQRELAKREARRELILSHVCPECGNDLKDHTMPKTGDKFNWFKCVSCGLTTGVAKR